MTQTGCPHAIMFPLVERGSAMGAGIAEVDWITCVDDGLDDGVFVPHRARGRQHRTLCGSPVTEAPQACVPRPPCPDCSRAALRREPAKRTRRWFSRAA